MLGRAIAVKGRAVNLERLTGAYTLSRLTVTPTQLLLDPTNPRLITQSSQERHYAAEELSSPDIQKHVLELVCRKEHEVKTSDCQH